MDDATGRAEALLGLSEFRVLDVVEFPDELWISVETIVDMVGCSRCGVRALAHERRRVDIRDLRCFGRPARLIWLKRRWRCGDPDCEAKTWTEESDQVPARALLTERAGAEAHAGWASWPSPSPSVVARELGMCWWTVMEAVVFHGTPLVEDPERVGSVRALGIDETSFLSANRDHHTIYATGLVDLDDPKVIDMVEGNSAADLGRRFSAQVGSWLETIEAVATDLAESYRRGMAGHLDHAVRVADPFHVVRVANRALDKVRRRVQAALGHRGRKGDPLYRIRKLLLKGSERLDERGHERMLLGLRRGDPHDEVLGAWLAKESVRDIYLTERVGEARTLLRRPSRPARATKCPRSVPSATPSSAGRLRSSTTTALARRTVRPRA